MQDLMRFDFNEIKFRELVLYIARGAEGDDTFGAIKLNKILFYSDFAAYRQLGRPITGATYQKLREGPGPREMLRQRRVLLDTGDADIEHREYFTGVQQRIRVSSHRKVAVELFEPRELGIVNQVMGFFWGKSAREVSDFSHGEPGWQLAEFGETIPYETAWLSSEPPDQETEDKTQRATTSRG